MIRYKIKYRYASFCWRSDTELLMRKKFPNTKQCWSHINDKTLLNMHDKNNLTYIINYTYFLLPGLNKTSGNTPFMNMM